MNFLHVFRYGARSNSQRWAFRFCLPPVIKSNRRGRPAASLRVSGFSRTDAEGEETSFWAAEQAALEADFWKLVLMRNFGLRNLEYSFSSYEYFAAAFRAKYNKEVEACVEDVSFYSEEFNSFLATNEEILFQHASLATPEGWNADLELFLARRRIQEIQAGAPGDLVQAHLLEDWATKLKDHQDLVRDVNAYGLSRLEYEVNLPVMCLRKLLVASPIARIKKPEKAHHKLLGMLDASEQNIKALKEALGACEAAAVLFAEFKTMLTARSEDLKKSRPEVFLGL